LTKIFKGVRRLERSFGGMMKTKNKELLFILLVITGGLYFAVTGNSDVDTGIELSMITAEEKNPADDGDSHGILSTCERVDSISESPTLEVTGLPVAVVFYLHSGKVAGLYAPPEIYMYKDYFYSFQLRKMSKAFYEVLEINPRHCDSKKQPKDLKLIIPRQFEDKNMPRDIPGPTLQLAGVFFYPYL
jgi:hypothetical protein